MTKEGETYFDRMKRNLIANLNTCAIGKIEAFDGEKMQASVIVFPDEDLVQNAPVMAIQTSDFYIRVPYQKGDMVLVAFAQRDIDPVLYGGNEPSERMLSKDDAVVIGGINLFTQSLPSQDANKLVLGQKDGDAKITMGNGDIDINANNITLTGSNSVTANGEDLTTDNV